MIYPNMVPIPITAETVKIKKITRKFSSWDELMVELVSCTKLRTLSISGKVLYPEWNTKIPYEVKNRLTSFTLKCFAISEEGMNSITDLLMNNGSLESLCLNSS